MSRQGYGLHRLTGGIAKREREAWERIKRGTTCHAVRCPVPATVLVQNAVGMLYPACTVHGEQGRRLGYTVLERREDAVRDSPQIRERAEAYIDGTTALSGGNVRPEAREAAHREGGSLDSPTTTSGGRRWLT